MARGHEYNSSPVPLLDQVYTGLTFFVNNQLDFKLFSFSYKGCPIPLTMMTVATLQSSSKCCRLFPCSAL